MSDSPSQPNVAMLLLNAQPKAPAPDTTGAGAFGWAFNGINPVCGET